MSQLSSRARVELAKAALSRIGLESPELRPYQDEPAQMPSGTVGKGTCGLSSPIGAIAA